MTVLRYSQEAIGWVYSFKALGLSALWQLITAIFTANLFGLFELRLSSNMNTKIATAGGQGYSRHFWKGLLLAAVCRQRVLPHSLGTAVAYALIQQSRVIVVEFRNAINLINHIRYSTLLSLHVANRNSQRQELRTQRC